MERRAPPSASYWKEPSQSQCAGAYTAAVGLVAKSHGAGRTSIFLKSRRQRAPLAGGHSAQVPAGPRLCCRWFGSWLHPWPFETHNLLRSSPRQTCGNVRSSARTNPTKARETRKATSSIVDFLTRGAGLTQDQWHKIKNRQQRLVLCRLMIDLMRGVHTVYAPASEPFGTRLETFFIALCVALGHMDGQQGAWYRGAERHRCCGDSGCGPGRLHSAARLSGQ